MDEYDVIVMLDPSDLDEYYAYEDRMILEHTFDEAMLHPNGSGAEYLAAWWAYNEEDN